MEFKKEKVYTPLAATPTHNVSQAIKYGDLVFVSGMVGEDAVSYTHLTLPTNSLV